MKLVKSFVEYRARSHHAAGEFLTFLLPCVGGRKPVKLKLPEICLLLYGNKF